MLFLAGWREQTTMSEMTTGIFRREKNEQICSHIWFNFSSVCREILYELFQILKDDAVKVLHSICQQIWKNQQWPQDWKRSVFIPIPKKGNVKECSNYCTIVLISHARKVMLKILQARLPQYTTENFLMYKV